MQVVTVKQAGLLLAEASRPFNPSTIVNSEIHVLSTLKFDVIINSYSYILSILTFILTCFLLTFQVDVPPVSEFVNLLLCKLVYLLKREKTTPSSQNFLASIDKIRELSLMLVQCIYLDGSEAKERLMAVSSDHQGDNSHDDDPRYEPCFFLFLSRCFTKIFSQETISKNL